MCGRTLAFQESRGTKQERTRTHERDERHRLRGPEPLDERSVMLQRPRAESTRHEDQIVPSKSCRTRRHTLTASGRSHIR